MNEYPLSIVEHVGFNRYSTSLHPVFQVPWRNTIKREISTIYQEERSIALNLLDSPQGRVAITLDMWTVSNKKRAAHYIDRSWTLKSQI